jgi:tetratricopeptide (TPR) repeat protein
VFKHALVQDAAYDSLLKRRRAQIHEQIAHALEARFPDVQEDEPELLAHHYTGAELPEQAIPYWRRAGELAVRRLALQDAIAHLDRGMVLVKQLAPSRERDVAELELRALSGIAWQLLHGWTVPQARDHAEAAWALAKSLGRTDHMIRILWTLWVYYVNDGHIREAVTWVNQLIAEGRRLGSDAMELAGHAAGTCASHFLAEWDAVFRHADQVEAGYDLSRHRVVTDLVAFDPLSTACSFKALAQWKTGFPDQATATSELATRHARAIGHGSNQCFVLLLACGLHYYRRDQVRLKEAADELDRVAQEHGLGYYAFFQVPNQRARLLLLSGDFAQAESAYRAAIELRERFGQRLGVGATSTIQAICAASLGHHGAALRFLDEAIAQIERPGWEERTDLAEVLRVKGWVHTLAGDLAAAERNYRASLEVACAQRATSWELRTATSLARLWQRQGKQKAAHELLAPVYNWFTEGFETKDLKEAKALLEDLSRC